MINNLELIKPLLNFDDENDFYMLYIFKRKKDQPEGEKDNHQSIRTIKTYCVNSIEYLNKRWEEITHLCEYFKARAYIHVQKQNHKDVSLNLMELLCSRIRNGVHNQSHIFDSVVGQLKTNEKRWIVDLDRDNMDEIEFLDLMGDVGHTIDNYCEPIEKDFYWEYNKDKPIKVVETDKIISKILKSIPTKNGVHIITKPFNLETFKKSFPNVEVQKKNPTLLYYPKSLEI